MKHKHAVTWNSKLVFVSGLAGAFAESVSMPSEFKNPFQSVVPYFLLAAFIGYFIGSLLGVFYA